MAATLTQERFTGPEWIFERKFDGIRLLAFKQGADVRLLLAQSPAAEQPIPSVADAIASAAGATMRSSTAKRWRWERRGAYRFTSSTCCGSTAAT